MIYYLCLFLGYFIFRYVKKYRYIESIIGGFRSIPAIAWIPVLSVLGILLGTTGVFLFIFSGVFPLVMSQIILGIKNSPEEINHTLSLYKIRPFKSYWTIIRQSQEKIFLQALAYGLSLSLILMLVYEVFFEKTAGIMRIIQPLSIGYDLKDALLLVLLVMSVGVLLDRIPKFILEYRILIRRNRARKIAKRIKNYVNDRKM